MLFVKQHASVKVSLSEPPHDISETPKYHNNKKLDAGAMSCLSCWNALWTSEVPHILDRGIWLKYVSPFFFWDTGSATV